MTTFIRSCPSTPSPRFHQRRKFARLLGVTVLSAFVHSGLCWAAVCAQEATTVFVKAAEPLTDAEEFGRGVRTTEPRTPEEERQGFHLPEGLTIELVASEPEIAKPLNIAFDWKGRLWVTQTYEYPYPYDASKDLENKGPRDGIVILEDKDGDGYRETVTKFADQMNIPIGILPYEDGALCFNIPNIYMLRDTDGDSICDQRDIVLGPFDTTRDTHGMVNSLRWMPNGWVMANHGFNNQSKVAGTDGKSVFLPSGNVFRFRPDGQSIEVYGNGQVNPFGMTIDTYGNVFTADCHSKPISQVIPGGFYQSFGRPHDGLGFVPDVMDHLHGSTAIAGLEIGLGSVLPELYADQFLSGNVMTSRINRNQIVRKGLSVTAVEESDLLTSDDPWFRPVDIRLGPDGWLYVADFYNRIIGHYEVPLQHEGRDRFRGRIWRIGRKDGATTSALDLESAKACIDSLGSQNPTIVRLALQRLSELSRKDESQVASALNESPLGAQASSTEFAARAWVHTFANKSVSLSPVVDQFSSSDDLVSANALRTVQADLAKYNDEELTKAKDAARKALHDWKTRPHTAFVAGQLMTQIGVAQDAHLVLQTIAACKADDVILYSSLRIALREMLRSKDAREILLQGWEPQLACAQSADVAVTKDKNAAAESVLVSIDSPEGQELFDVLIALPAGEFPAKAGFAYLEKNLDGSSIPQSLLVAMATALSADEIPDLFCLLEKATAGNQALYLEQLATVVEVLKEQGKLNDEARRLISDFVRDWTVRFNSSNAERLVSWVGVGGASATANVRWQVEERPFQQPKDKTTLPVFSSFTMGEPYVGSMVSGILPKAEQVRFYLSGHNGDPKDPDTHKNRVELLDASSKEVLLFQYPPRTDAAAEVVWDLKPYADRSLEIRIVDGDTGGAYAWIAAGGFEPDGISARADRTELHRVLAILKTVGGLSDGVADQSRLSERRVDEYYQLLWSGRVTSQPAMEVVLAVWAWEHLQFDVATEAAKSLASSQPDVAASAMLQEIAKRSDALAQQDLALQLSTNSRSHELLLESVKQGWLSPNALNAIPTAWWDANVEKPVVKELVTFRPDANENAQEKMATFLQRRSEIAALAGDPEAGKALYAQQCALCHQFAGQGKVVGPQLEGVGGRGVERLCEDILLPNQNVDHAFRTIAVMTTEGNVISGLARQRDDKKLVLADAKGEEQTIALSDIEEERASNNSLMPENFGELLSSKQLADLIQYLRTPVK